ncbi:MAG: hypothetical protein ACTHN5_09665 [Phycisphaerae bacterium]
MSEQHPKKRGFAAISPERMREIASAGGVARKRAYDQARAAKGKGGAGMTMSSPGNAGQGMGDRKE